MGQQTTAPIQPTVYTSPAKPPAQPKAALAASLAEGRVCSCSDRSLGEHVREAGHVRCACPPVLNGGARREEEENRGHVRETVTPPCTTLLLQAVVSRLCCRSLSGGV